MESSTPTKTIYRKTAEPCRRCKGSGEYSHGFCYRCNGHGKEVIEVQVPMTAEDIAAVAENASINAAREARAQAVKDRIAARKAAEA